MISPPIVIYRTHCHASLQIDRLKKMLHQTHTLENGLSVVGEFDPDARSVALGFFVKTGARDENFALESGVSHFLEHMMFKGSPNRSAEQINRDFDALGARYNAFTSEEETVYYGAVLPPAQENLTEILADMLRPALRQSDFDTEKKVILEEIAMYRDRPTSRMWDLLRAKFYGEHPLGQSILGAASSIEKLQRDQMLDYFSRRYAANNISFVLTGNFDWQLAKTQIEALCGAWERFDSPRETAPIASPGGVFLEKTDEFNRAHIALMDVGYSTQDETRIAAAIACEIIGGGENSRLYWRLVHSGIATTATLGHDAQDGAGTFYGALICPPENAQTALTAFRDELENARAGVSPEELNRAKAGYASRIALGSETPMGRFRGVGFGWMYRRELLSGAQLLEKILAVQLDDVNAILRERFFENPTVAAVGPVENLRF